MRKKQLETWVVLAAIIIGGYWLFSTHGFKASISQPNSPSAPVETVNSCPSSGLTSFTVNLRNGLDTTSATQLDTQGYIYKIENGQETFYGTLSSTRDGTVEVSCPGTYELKLVSNSQVNSHVDSIDYGDATVDNGVVVFKANSAKESLGLVGSQHGTLEFKVFDNNNNAFVYPNDDSVATNWETSGVTYESTLGNSTATAVNAGGELNYKYYVRVHDSTTSKFDDFGAYILVDAPTSVWNEPTVTFDGVKLSNVKGSLTPSEAIAFSDYEYVYKVPAGAKLDDTTHTIGFDVKALTGIDPSSSDSIKVDFASIGSYLSIDGKTVKTGAVEDNTAHTPVFALQETTLAVQ